MTKNTFNLYKLLGYKRKNSILKSVTITSNYIEAGRFRVVEVEPYDQTGQNCLDTTPTRGLPVLSISKELIKWKTKTPRKLHQIK